MVIIQNGAGDELPIVTTRHRHSLMTHTREYDTDTRSTNNSYFEAWSTKEACHFCFVINWINNASMRFLLFFLVSCFVDNTHLYLKFSYIITAIQHNRSTCLLLRKVFLAKSLTLRWHQIMTSVSWCGPAQFYWSFITCAERKVTTNGQTGIW